LAGEIQKNAPIAQPPAGTNYPRWHKAAYNKHRREDVLPLHAEITALFKQWKEERNEYADTKVFCTGKYTKWAKMLKSDLEKAGIPYKDELGRIADFHSLCHTFITNVVKGGASPKVAQGLARHSKITLTMDTYTYLSLHDQRVALDGLPELPCLNSTKTNHGQAAYLKTGIDNQPVGAYKSAYKNAYFGNQPLSAIVPVNNTKQGNSVGSKGVDKSLLIATLGTNENALSAIVTDEAFNEAEGARTLNLRIDSPTL
jgi:hypothetical protein